ncbi:Protein CBR-SRX-13 [Caenorhabditis briggsae]|uniref:Protein CBR-SRX-13 n=1 Tax=Caenorhabditis briggsae TaxID=6238 RepID=A8X6I5_CAEBR|nr:Protein CBR-SRX-13 [Caenorhabditis briggsae]CAP28246.2 Protein CBR-SRX-13 [Caenorhabditis briggsae]
MVCVLHSHLCMGDLSLFGWPITLHRHFNPWKSHGQLHILFWTSLLYSHLFLSLNRLTSLLFPPTSRLIFSHLVCLSLILSTWLIGLLHIIIPLLWSHTCYLIYNPATWIWLMSGTTCGNTLVLQYLCLFVAGISFLLNLSTWISISEETIRRHPIESKLLREELWRAMGFLMAATSSNVLSGWLGERWQKYALTCVVWQGYHLLDGLFVLVFHFHRKLLAKHKMEEPHHTLSFIHVDHPGRHSSPHAPITHHPVHFSRVDTS